MISSSQKDPQESERVVSSEEKKIDTTSFQNTFRPKTLEGYI